MQAFLERFYEGVDRNLGDPHASARYPKSAKLADLHSVDRQIYESLLKVTGQESLLGYAEATITLKDGVEFYKLPPGFRQFRQLEKRTTDGRVQFIIRSKPFYGSEYGVDIITASRGFRLSPPPRLDADQDWVLIYSRSTDLLHYAQTPSKPGSRTIFSGTPGTNAGELVLIDDYYNGMGLRVYSASTGVPQEMEIEFYRVLGDRGIFNFRHPFSPIPTGDVWYEIMPVLPYPYDSIYALDVALLALNRREKPIKANSLIRDRRREWASCKSYYLSNVTDRGPSRTLPLTRMDLAATGEIPY